MTKKAPSDKHANHRDQVTETADSPLSVMADLLRRGESLTNQKRLQLWAVTELAIAQHWPHPNTSAAAATDDTLLEHSSCKL